MVQGIDQIGSRTDSFIQPGNQKNKKGNSVTEVKIDYKLSFQKETLTAITYNRSAKIETADLDGVTDLRELVTRLLERQGITWQAAMDGETVEIDEETRAEAQALIADDGYWGIEQTSERIFQLAVANAGGDSTALDRVKMAVEKGFDMAKEVLGDAMPEISIKTFDAVMEKLESWAQAELPSS